MNKKNLPIIVSVILIISAIIPFFAISFYNYPSADDLVYSADVRLMGPFWYIKDSYINWGGRYFSALLEAINPLVYNFSFGYKVLPVIFLILTYLGLYFFIKKLIDPQIKKKNIFFYTALLFALILQILPSPVEGFYWMTGAIEYTTPFIIILFLFPYIVQNNDTNLKWNNYIVIALLILCIAGSNEIVILLVTGITFLLWIAEILTKKNIFKISFILVFSIIGTLIVVLAPGNYARMDMFSKHGQIIESISGALISFIKIALNIFVKPSFLLLSFAALAYFSKKSLKIKHSLLELKYIIFLYPLFSILILISLLFLPFYAMGIQPPMHVNNIISLFFFLLWFFYLAIVGQYFYVNRVPLFLNIQLNKFPILVLLSVILFYTGIIKSPSGNFSLMGNTTKAWSDLIYKAKGYDDEMQHRLNLISKAKTEKKDTVIFQSLKYKPETIFFIDITDDPAYWLNQCYSSYYKIKAVKNND